jgi:hypothetical protein
MSVNTAVALYSSRTNQWDLTRKPAPFEQHSGVTEEPGVHRMPMWLFVANGQRVICRRPVEVEIREEEDAVIAACQRLHVFSSGDSYEEAINSLHEQVVHFFQEYSALGEDEVIGRAVEIRELYHRYFELAGQE